MRALVLSGAFGLENLRLEERAEPEPGPSELCVRVRAVSLNYRDLLMVRGEYNPRQPLPLVPASDAVGEVVRVGNAVTRFKPGDRVCPIFAQSWLDGPQTRTTLKSTLGGPLDGTLREFACFDEQGLVAAPPHLSDAEAATLACAGVTAYSALHQARVKSGSTVLVLGTGGVSMFALGFAKLLGARVLVTSKSDEKLSRARALGADATLNYVATPDWSAWARAETSGDGVDLVLEVGGASTFEHSLRAVRPSGHISLIGVLGGRSTTLDLPRITMQNLTVQGTLVGPRSAFEAMNQLIASSGFRPSVDRAFPLAQARDAFEYLARGEHFGKICVELGG
jgi:NADPH:quinone reductase-like Zn-dependent oxidoreductase